MKPENVELLKDYNHLINVDGFHVYYRPDKVDDGHRELFIVIPQRGVSVSVSNHDKPWFGGVHVSANQGIHDPWVQSEAIVNPSFNIPDGEAITNRFFESEDFECEERKHLMNAEGFKILYEPDEDGVDAYSLYIVMQERGVSLSISYHDHASRVHVLAGQGLHDTYGNFDDGSFEMSISIPDGERL